MRFLPASSALAHIVGQLALFRLLAGVGIGGEWSLAGTYVAESWPEDRRKMGAGYLQTGYYFGFFLAGVLNYTVWVHFGWRAMFLCGLCAVLVALLIASRVREPERWNPKSSNGPNASMTRSFSEIFSSLYRKKTIVNAGLLTVAIIGLWAGTVYEPTAVLTLALKMGRSAGEASKLASLVTGVLSIGTIIGCVIAPQLAERFGRKKALASYFLGMGACIFLSFGVMFYRSNALIPFVASQFRYF
jgi:MFS family permease